MMIDPARTFSIVRTSVANRDVLRIIKRAAHGARPRNPILIRGPVGTGKTQLLHATANAMLAAARSVRLLTAADFRDGFTDAIYTSWLQVDRYRAYFASGDALLVDGLEDLARFPTVEAELGTAAHSVVAAGGLVVISLATTSPEHVTRLRAWSKQFPRATLLSWRAPSMDVRVAALVQTARTLGLRRRDVIDAARGARTIPEATALLHRKALTSAQRRRA